MPLILRIDTLKNSKGQPISPSEFIFDGKCSPSRELNIIFEGKKHYLATVKEIPKKPFGGGGGLKSSPQTSGGDLNTDIYCTADPDVCGQWDGVNHKLRFNENWPIVKELWCRSYPTFSPIPPKLRRIYLDAQKMAQYLSQGYKGVICKQFRSEHDSEKFEDNPLNYLVHLMLKGFFEMSDVQLEISKIQDSLAQDSMPCEPEE